MNDFSQYTNLMEDCTICPRKCHVNRLQKQTGFCGQSDSIFAARAALHYWEEPCISGTKGSGTVFFSGCNLRCVFCQNHNIALGNVGQEITSSRLSEIFLELQQKGAHNINLVTPTHFVAQIIPALIHAKEAGLTIPIVYNTGSYEEVSTLRLLDGLVDIYLPDLKYYSAELSTSFSHAADYFAKASAAINEMYRQVGAPVFDESGLLRRGMIVRHLVLPEQTKDSKKILRYLHETYGNNIYISIMNQYTPLAHVAENPLLNHPVSHKDYEKILTFAEQIGIENGFMQDGEVAMESFIPSFNLEGL